MIAQKLYTPQQLILPEMGEELTSSRPNIQSPIKWPGGKSEEFKYIEHLIPMYNRYIEPFFGGGAIFFKLQPQQAIINDISVELIDFYRFLKGDYETELFETELFKYVIHWETISEYVSIFGDTFTQLYHDFQSAKMSQVELKKQVTFYIQQQESIFKQFFAEDFCLDSKNLLRQIRENLASKIKRTSDISQKHGELSSHDLRMNIETAFRSGFYMHFRDILNFSDTYSVSHAKKIANYYFIREFCYGAMFRYNKQGHFNIPYGGSAYNTKDFRGKVSRLFLPEFRGLFTNVTVERLDFENLFEKYAMSEHDFIFLDPPYDSEFSGYGNQEFNQDDHKRLANVLYHTPAKFIMIIKETPFILGLYQGMRDFQIEEFGKQYLYNVKGRNNQNANHLIIYRV